MSNLTEKEMSAIWQSQWLKRDEIATVDGRWLRVIYPGQPNDDRGADFRDAVIDGGRGPVRGDIEIHIRSSQWREHGHHLDPAYNRVILHVVMWHNTASDIRLENGREVPTVALSQYVRAPRSECLGSTGLCAGSGLSCIGALHCLGHK